MKEFVIELSGVFSQEGFNCPEPSNYLDLRQLEGTCCYLDSDSEPVLKAALPQPGGLNWIDTGDYHYLSLLMLRKLPFPVRLLLIDNHTDEFPYEGQLSCGNWVSAAKQEGLITTEDSAPLYISLDLDALSPAEFSTNWDQGSLSYHKLLKTLENAISGASTVAGIDICGGLTISKGASDCQLDRNRELRESLRTFINTLL